MEPAPGLVRLEFEVIEHALNVPFTIAGGGMDTARAVITRAVREDGTTGLGESAPFPVVSGETVESTLDVLRDVADSLGGLEPPAALTAANAAAAGPALASAPAARCGLEQALLDARLRAAGQSLRDWMPPAVDEIETDLTLPVGPAEAALDFVADAVARGFRTLKVKVGGRELATDLDVLGTIHGAFPGLTLVLDGNAAYDLDTARQLLTRLGRARIPIALLEQPLAREAIADAAALQRTTDVPVCLDESLRDLADLEAILEHPELRSINIKTMKLGLGPAVAVLRRARDAGLSCMVGAMVESTLSLTVSAALAMHFADVVHHVDLDTALFMKPGPVTGGIVYDGPLIRMPGGMVGHGAAVA